MAQIVPVVSESLEAKVRDLLPSQRGFGEDLQASNVIVPIIDITSTSTASSTPEMLQTALAFGSQTAFEANNSTVVIANTPGFHRIYAGIQKTSPSGDAVQCNITMSDGLTTKTIWGLETPSFINAANGVVIDIIVFLRSGDSVSCVTDNADAFIKGSVRQIADVNGELVNPVGFTPQ